MLMTRPVLKLIWVSSILSNKSNRMVYWSLVDYTVSEDGLKHSSSGWSSLFSCVSHKLLAQLRQDSKPRFISSFSATHFKWSNCQLPLSSLDCCSGNRVSFLTSVPQHVLDCIFTNQYLLMWQLGHQKKYLRFIAPAVAPPSEQWNRCCASFAH